VRYRSIAFAVNILWSVPLRHAETMSIGNVRHEPEQVQARSTPAFTGGIRREPSGIYAPPALSPYRPTPDERLCEMIEVFYGSVEMRGAPSTYEPLPPTSPLHPEVTPTSVWESGRTGLETDLHAQENDPR